jgi:hypothetical protein
MKLQKSHLLTIFFASAMDLSQGKVDKYVLDVEAFAVSPHPPQHHVQLRQPQHPNQYVKIQLHLVLVYARLPSFLNLNFMEWFTCYR